MTILRSDKLPRLLGLPMLWSAEALEPSDWLALWEEDDLGALRFPKKDREMSRVCRDDDDDEDGGGRRGSLTSLTTTSFTSFGGEGGYCGIAVTPGVEGSPV